MHTLCQTGIRQASGPIISRKMLMRKDLQICGCVRRHASTAEEITPREERATTRFTREVLLKFRAAGTAIVGAMPWRNKPSQLAEPR
jgi:hypothetical protein